MHKPESVLDDETYKLIWDFKIQTDRLISARRPDTIIINKKKKKRKKRERTCKIVNFAVPTDHWVKFKESEKKDKYLLGLCLRIEKTEEHESDGDTNCNWCSW